MSVRSAHYSHRIACDTIRMVAVGLTGGIASGKSTVSARLVALGAYVVDADQLARLAMTRGATTPPAIYQERPVVGLGSGPRRYRRRSANTATP